MSGARDWPASPVAVAHRLDEVVPGPSVITIGNFDGVHRGHRVLLKRAVSAAEDADVRSVAVTFHPHPAAVLRPGSEPAAIQSLEDRSTGLLRVGVDLVLVLPFTRELSSLSPDAFVEQVLVDRLQATKVIVGANFRFGHKAAGDVVTLTDAGAVHGFATEAVTLLELDGAPISSSEVRRRIAEGDLGWANRALGRPFELRGEVVRGEARGRTIGFPTANVEVPAGRLLPAHGVYVCEAELAGERLGAVTNVGTRPTFDGQGTTVEVHLLDVDRDLYGHELTVRFLDRLRGERRFGGLEELRAQIRVDADAARAALAART
ncbi:bifunctional riboflavin kinase/FAD synthetase [Nitriliruptoraceae bacterium ZYF776]|nr:bifunctional riboflavin kinase/FAD synthetase [Profundirhabdus halotolerans]